MDLKEVDYLLKLSRLEIEPEEKEKITSQLEDILNFVKKLQEIDTENVEPVAGGTDLVNVLRQDQEKPRDLEVINQLKEMGREISDDYFKIPPIFE
ncbi:MAG: Asp-tRNA(Asn)/Glu-tRNA(Gln) amidotransferase subunit GatC [Candidatus Paceibacterota bacterium]